MLSIGIAGESPKNGHPFSFSAIVNGFRSENIRAAGWGLIADYLEAAQPGEIGGLGAKVTHVWFPDRNRARVLSEGTGIDKVAESFEELVANVDAVMILRDDWRNNFEMALSSLRLGKVTFVDKPLTLNLKHIDVFEPYLRSGQLMTGSGLRFSPELSDFRMNSIAKPDPGRPVIIVASGPGDWEHNSMHLLEPSFVLAKKLGFNPLEEGAFSVFRPKGILPGVPESINQQLSAHQGSPTSQQDQLFFFSERLILIMELQSTAQSPPFQLKCSYGAELPKTVLLQNRLAAFRGLLTAFIASASTGAPFVPSDETMWCLQRGAEGQERILSFSKLRA